MEKFAKKPFYKKWWFYLILVLVIGGIGSTLGDDEPNSGGQADSSEKDEDTSKETPKEEKSTFSLGEIISYKDFDLIITNQREVEGFTDGKYIVFDVEVISKEDNFTFFGTFQGVTEDNEVVSDTIPFVEDDLGDPITISFTKSLDKEQKAKGYLAFDKTISKIEVSSSFFSNKKITVNLK